MALKEYATPEEIRSFRKLFVKDANDEDDPLNQSLLNVTRFALDGWSHTSLRFFTFHPDSDPKPLLGFVTEQSDIQIPSLGVRSPLVLPEKKLLVEGLSLILGVLQKSIEEHGELVVDVDAAVKELIASLLQPSGFKITFDVDERFFYMTTQQLTEAKEMSLSLPAGFAFSELREDEAQILLDAWGVSSASLDGMRMRIRHLPSAAIRSTEGQLVAWEIFSPSIGKLNHLYTLPEFRGHGLGVAVEMKLAQISAQKGLRVFKNVLATNTKVIEGTMRHPLWTHWRNDDGSSRLRAVTFLGRVNNNK